MEKIRTFIAINIEDKLKTKMISLKKEMEDLSSYVKWVNFDGIHITLRFLGNISLKMVKEIGDALEKIDLPFFELHFKGLGVFPNISNPRVLWIGAEDPKEVIFLLQKEIENILEKFGFKKEQDFIPHVTLCRKAKKM